MCRNLLVIALAFTAPGPSQAEDWPQFRGPGGQGHAAAKNMPLRWSESEGIAWKVPVEGRGWSSPVVAGNQVWLTTAEETAATEEETRRAVERANVRVPDPFTAGHVTLKALCFDRDSGAVLHNLTLFEVTEPVLLNPTNSFASPTAVVQDGRVYCDFGAMGTVCLNGATGKVIWSRRLAVEHQVGPGSSPVLCGDLLILVRDGCDRQYVTALDKTTGKTVWETDRPPLDTPTVEFRKAFSTPLLFQDGTAEQLVIPAAQWIASYDPVTGAERWRVDTGASYSNASRPVYGNGKVYVCTAYGGTFMLAIRTDGRGDVTDTHVTWQLRRGTPRRSSPLLVGERLFFVSDSGIANCVDAVTGEVRWSERLGEAHSASPVYAAGRVYFFGEDGTVTVVRPADTFARLAENRLNGRIMASPAFVDRSIFIRTDTHLYRVKSEE